MDKKLTKGEQTIKSYGFPKIWAAGVYNRTHEMFMGKRTGFEFFGFGIFNYGGFIWIELTIFNYLCTIGIARGVKIVGSPS